MKAKVTAKKDGTSHKVEVDAIVLDRPSVVHLKLAPERVDHYERRGDDLVLVLRDGSEIVVHDFFVQYPSEGQNDQHDAGQTQTADGAAGDAPADNGRNDLVLEDENGVAWWGQYTSPWGAFHFTEIESDGGVALWPWLLGAVGVAGVALAADDNDHHRGNEAPVAPGATQTTVEDTPVSGKVTGSDADGDPLTYGKGSDPSHGSVVVNADGSYTYTPAPNYNGDDSFTVTVDDGQGGTTTSTVNITVTPANDPPVAPDDAKTTPEDTPVSGQITGSDVDGDPLTYGKGSDPSHGSVVVNADGSYTYTPAPNYNGDDSFTVTVDDGQGGTTTSTVNITVTPANDPPVAPDDAKTTPEDTPVSGQITGSDVDGDPLTYGKGSDPSHGSVVVNADGSYTYTPAPNYNGDDSFTVTVDDGQGGTTTSTVNITVTPVNDPPVAPDDAKTTPEDTPVSGQITGSDVDGDPLTYGKGSDPSHGSVVVNADGSYTYTPAPNYNGDDSFTVTVDDGQGGTTTSTVNITVTPANDPPVAPDDAKTTPEDTPISGQITGSDVDGDPLTYGKGSDPSHGSVVVNADGSYTYTPAPNYNGDDSFTVTVDDGQGGTTTSTVNITVTPVSDPPVAENDAKTTPEDTPVSGNVLGNDSDPDGDTLEVTTFTVAGDATVHTAGDTVSLASGSLTLGADGGYTFTPAANWNGSVPQVTYTVSDGEGGTATAQLNITVTPVNDPPVAPDDAKTTPEDTPISGQITGSDVDGDPLTYGKGSDPSHGSVVVNPDGSYIYTPAPDYNGDDSFTVTVDDGQGGTTTSTVNITVTPVNDPPVAGNDATTTAEDTQVTGNVLGNDSDPDGDTLEVTTFTVAGDATVHTAGDTVSLASGSLTLGADGGYTFTPAANWNGSVPQVTYTVSDGEGGTATAQLNITVTPVNDPPVAPDDAKTTPEDTPISGQITGSDVDGDPLTYGKGSDPSHGSVVVNADGSYTYTPAPNYNGDDSFTVTVDDGQGGTTTSTVNITVTPANDPPVTVGTIADQSNADDDGVAGLDVKGSFQDIDTAALTYSATGLPAGLSIDPATGVISGTLDHSASQGGTGGVYSVTVTASDGGAVTAMQTFNWTVTNPAPTAGNDTQTTAEDTQVTGNVLGNDSDPDGDTLEVTTFTVAGDATVHTAGATVSLASGALTLNADGSYTFTPAADWNGAVPQVTYTVSDGEGGTATAHLDITVTPVNDPPVTVGTIADQSNADHDGVAGLDVKGFFQDIDTAALTYSATGLPAGLSIDSTTGVISGTLDHSASQGGIGGVYGVTVTASDGGTVTATQTFNWTVTNPAPTAGNDTQTTAEDTQVTGNVLGNDSDVDGDTISVTTFTVAGDATVRTAGDTVSLASGSLTLDADGSYTFTPAADWNGSVPQVTYTVSDGEGGTATAQLNITVTPVNDPPVAPDDAKTTPEDTPISGQITGSDVDGDPLTYGKGSDPSHGSVVVNPDGSYIYTPAPDYNGDDSFTVTVDDGQGGTTTSTVNITVTPANDPPVAPDDAKTTPEDTPISGQITGSDVDGDPLTYGKGSDPSHGSVVVNADGSYTYTPAPNYNGDDSFTVTVDDGQGGTTTSTVNITVTPVNDPPVTVGTIADQSNADDDGVAGLDVKGSFQDIDTAALTYSATGLPAGLSIDPATGVISGTLDHSASQGGTGGVYSVTVTASDGGAVTATQTFSWTVTNPAPTAGNDIQTTPEDTTVTGNVLGNDSDPDGDTIKVTTFTVAGDATVRTAGDVVSLASGALTLNADGSYTFTPAADWNGAVPQVTYTVSDGEGGTATAQLNITVTPVNDPPVIDGGTLAGTVIEAGNLDDGTVTPGTPSASGTLNAHDVDGDTLAWSVVGTPDATYGSFAVNPATGLWTYTLDNSLAATQALGEGQTVPLQFTVQASDGHSGTATQTIAVTLTGSNDSPVAVADTGVVKESGVQNGGNTSEPGTATATGNVLTNDTDVDSGDTRQVSAVGFGGTAGTVGTALVGTYGSLVLNSDGTYTYTLDNGDADTQALKQGATATEAFSYTAIDAHGATSTSTLTLAVIGTNDQPTITSTTTDAQGSVTEQGSTDPTAPNTTTGTLTAADVDTDATRSWSIVGAGTDGTYGTIGIDPATGRWTYTLDNTRAATQALNTGETRTETFTARVTDEHGAYSEQTITVTVSGSNDVPTGTGTATVSLSEDGSATGTLQGYVSDVDDTLAVTGFKVDTNGDGSDESFNAGDTATIRDSGGNTLGTLQINGNGGYTFTPAPNYAGNVPTVTYTMEEPTGGTSLTQTLQFNITKVSDAPTLDPAAVVSTNEDTAVALGLKAPVITDTGTAVAADNDYPERLGAITLTIGGAGASGVTLSTGPTTLTPQGNALTIVLTDVPHTSTVPAQDTANGIYYLTTAQYEALTANPSAESGKDFTVTVAATSYEVDATGAPIAGVAGASSSQVVTVDVQAVTDGASLALVGPPPAADLTFAEDTTLDLSSHLQATLASTDGSVGTFDTDGSERYWYSVSGLPQGAVVEINGASYTAGADGTVTSSQSATLTQAPAITVTPPANYSGDINGVTITLHTRDTDNDSTGTISELTSPVTLNLHVTPVAGDVSVGNVSTSEDTAVAFLANVKETDTAQGTEVIDSVSFTVPTGWVVTAPSAATGCHYALASGTATISFDTGVTEADREAYLHAFTITPPGNDSGDATISLSITSTDTNTVNGAPAPDKTTITRNVTVAVTPVAERTGSDTNQDTTTDVQMHGNETYTVAGNEDSWFALGTTYTGASNTSGGYALADGWANQDSDEFTYAALKPVLESGGAAGDSAIGSQFRYSTDNGATWVTRTYAGEAVWVPQQYLNTLQFLAAPNVSGTFQIQVQAVTVDYDDNSEQSAPTGPISSGAGVDVQTSGAATLDLVFIQPVADPVTMSLNGRAAGLEDTAIPLMVKVASADPSETFNVTIKDIPVGATITYGADASSQVFTAAAGDTSFTINGFSNTAPLTITPPANSNADFSLTVDAVSVDGSNTSSTSVASRPIAVSVTGVADTPTVTLATAYQTAEQTLDSGGHKVALNTLVTSVTSPDADGSEAVTMRITGLAEGFSVSGATMVTSGTGAERVWLVPAGGLAGASIVTPDNYSGTVNFQVAGVTTENDGNSLTGSLTNVSFTVTPSPEATIGGNTTLVEDQITPLNLSIQHQNGDTNETLGAVFMPMDLPAGSQYTLYLNGTELSAAGLSTTDIAGQSYYVIPANQVGQLGAKGASNLDGALGNLDFSYQVTDPSSDNTLSATTVINSATLALTATPVTDPVHASITAIDMTPATGTTADNTTGDQAAPDTATVTGQGTVTVNLHVASDDSDGSEHLIRVLIDGVPEGVTVNGAAQVGAGSWLLVYDGSNAQSIGTGGIEVPVQFLVGAGAGSGTSAITMTARAQDEGQLATTPAGIASDSVQWNLVLDLGPGQGYVPPTIVTWDYNDATGTEDTPFKLGDVIDAQVTTSSATVPYSYTVSVTGLPTGAEVSGMTLTTIGGMPTWTATVTVAAGGDSQAALDNLLSGITITPPADSNDNNADFSFTAHLAAAAVGGASVVADTVAAMPVTPVTDQAVVTVTTGPVDEGTQSVSATISASDPKDDSFGQIVDGKLYVQVATTNNAGGTVSSGGTALTLTPVTGVSGIPDGDYYVVDVPATGGSVGLTYTAAEGALLQPGGVTFTAWAQTQETNASNVESASGSGTAEVVIINNGVTVTSSAVSGNEAAAPDKANAIALAGLAVALNDNDGSEAIHSILLSKVPVGFLVYVGSSAGDAALAELAPNAGGDGTSNTWILASGGPLPAYVAILPAANWSGVLSGLALVVESGESSLSATRVQTIPLANLTVNPVANGITIGPTLSFGIEGDVISLNLNASMADPVLSMVAGDASYETTTLQITGLGAYAGFFIGSEPVDATQVTYDTATDTYTVTGLSQDDLDDLGFVQAASALTDKDGATSGTQLSVEAWTVESDGASASAHVTDTLTVQESKVTATTGDDRFIWDGQPINGDGGTDTVALRNGESVSHTDLAGKLSNIESIDLSAPGANGITGGLSLADVLSITGHNAGNASSAVLTISGSSDDSVVLSSTSEWTPSSTASDGYYAYTNTDGAKVLIDEDIVNNNHVSYV